MRIALAQVHPSRGALDRNVAAHVRQVAAARAAGARLVVFPELSLTGYEPTLAAELATSADDARLEPLQRAADDGGLVVAAGLPLRAPGRPQLALVLFHPGAPRTVCSKQHLHADELPFFAPGPARPGLVDLPPRVGLAICYELSVPEHAVAAFAAGAQVYVASAAKTEAGVAAAHERLAQVARAFAAPALLVNCVGTHDAAVCAGGSAAWSAAGERLAQLDAASEGLLVFDAATGRADVVAAVG